MVYSLVYSHIGPLKTTLAPHSITPYKYPLESILRAIQSHLSFKAN